MFSQDLLAFGSVAYEGFRSSVLTSLDLHRLDLRRLAATWIMCGW